MNFLWLIEVLFGFDNSSMTWATELSRSQHSTAQHSHTNTCLHVSRIRSGVLMLLKSCCVCSLCDCLAVASSVCVRCVCLVCAHCLWAIITNRFTIAESANKRWTRLHIIVFGYVPWCPARHRAARCIMHWNHINHVATCTLQNCSHTEPQVKLPGSQFYPPSPPPRLWYYAAYELFVDYLARQLILEQMLSVCPVIAH